MYCSSSPRTNVRTNAAAPLPPGQNCQVSATSSRIIAILYGFLATVLINTCEWAAGYSQSQRSSTL